MALGAPEVRDGYKLISDVVAAIREKRRLTGLIAQSPFAHLIEWRRRTGCPMNRAALIEAGFTAAQAAIILKSDQSVGAVLDTIDELGAHGAYAQDVEWAHPLGLTDAEIEEWLES